MGSDWAGQAARTDIYAPIAEGGLPEGEISVPAAYLSMARGMVPERVSVDMGIEMDGPPGHEVPGSVRISLSAPDGRSLEKAVRSLDALPPLSPAPEGRAPEKALEEARDRARSAVSEAISLCRDGPKGMSEASPILERASAEMPDSIPIARLISGRLSYAASLADRRSLLTSRAMAREEGMPGWGSQLAKGSIRDGAERLAEQLERISWDISRFREPDAWDMEQRGMMVKDLDEVLQDRYGDEPVILRVLPMDEMEKVLRSGMLSARDCPEGSPVAATSPDSCYARIQEHMGLDGDPCLPCGGIIAVPTDRETAALAQETMMAPQMPLGDRFEAIVTDEGRDSLEAMFPGLSGNIVTYIEAVEDRSLPDMTLEARIRMAGGRQDGKEGEKGDDRETEPMATGIKDEDLEIG